MVSHAYRLCGFDLRISPQEVLYPEEVVQVFCSAVSSRCFVEDCCEATVLTPETGPVIHTKAETHS